MLSNGVRIRDKMIIRARFVIPMDQPPIQDGAVAIAGGRIAAVGGFHEIRQRHGDDDVLDLGDQLLLPGLINAHCHLDYTCLRGKISPTAHFADWIRAINRQKERLTEADYKNSIVEGSAECLKFGTTTVVNLTGFPNLVSSLNLQPLRVWWLAELIDVRDPAEAETKIGCAAAALEGEEHWGFAPHSLYTASPALYQRAAGIAGAKGLLLSTHLAESRSEMAMFRDGAGELYQFLRGIGRTMDDCRGTTPLDAFLQIIRTVGQANGREQSWILAHLNELADDDFDRLAKSHSQLHVAYCPRSHSYFGHAPFEFARLRQSGLNISLGTDSLASNASLSLFAEMREFQSQFPELPAAEILELVTINPARALGLSDSLGKIQPGFYADLIAIPYHEAVDPFEQVIGYDGEVTWLMTKGAPAAN